MQVCRFTHWIIIVNAVYFDFFHLMFFKRHIINIWIYVVISMESYF